ncbi:MAG: TnpV protein [bacterium]|nr:TnpV protein [bacterium]
MIFDFEEKELIFKFGIEERLVLIEELLNAMSELNVMRYTDAFEAEKHALMLSTVEKLREMTDDEYEALAEDLEIGYRDPSEGLPNSLVDEYIIGADYEFFERDEREAEEAVRSMGTYARKRMNFMKEHRRKDYLLMLLDHSLVDYLRYTDESATSCLNNIMERMTEKDPPPDKETHPMEWVGHMNMTKAMAEEFVLREYIYY